MKVGLALAGIAVLALAYFLLRDNTSLFPWAHDNQQGWTLWGHTYFVTDKDENSNWFFYDSYPALVDCRAQISSESAKMKKRFEEARDLPAAKDRKITFQHEKQGIKMTVISSTASENDKPSTTTVRFFAFPLDWTHVQKIQ